MTPVSLGSDLFLLLRIVGAGAILWVFPWRRAAAHWFPGIAGVGRVCLAFALGVFATVLSHYLLAILGLYSPLAGLFVHLLLACCAWAFLPAQVEDHAQEEVSTIVPVVVGLAVLAALLIRLPDPLSHRALGGNDPWGHLVLCKALAQGDLLASYHFFGYYPRGYHFLVLLLSELTRGSVYEIMRLSGPLLAILGVLGAYAVGKRFSSSMGGLIAAVVYAVPAYQHLVLPALQTTLEPDRFSFVLLPAFLLALIEGIDRREKQSSVFLLVGGISVVLIHPLSVQFLVGWMLLAGVTAIATGKRWEKAAAFIAPAVVVVLFAWAYYRVMYSVYGMKPMPHRAPDHVLSIGGHGVDFQRLVFGTGINAQVGDLAALAVILLLGVLFVRKREPGPFFAGLVLLHTLYAAVADALYIGDFGHAPPYYAMAFAWAGGAGLGHRAVSTAWRFLPLVLLAAVLMSSPFSSNGEVWLKAILISLLAVGSLVALLRRYSMELILPISLGAALIAVRPIPVTYAHLGYPEAVEWALKLRSCPEGTVYSLGLISRLPDGTPFPTQNPIASIVWPTHTPKALERLSAIPANGDLEEGERAYVFIEYEPYDWSFPYYQKEDRRAVLRDVESWLTARRAAGALVRVLSQSDHMMLLALHTREAGECQPFQS